MIITRINGGWYIGLTEFEGRLCTFFASSVGALFDKADAYRNKKYLH